MDTDDNMYVLHQNVNDLRVSVLEVMEKKGIEANAPLGFKQDALYAAVSCMPLQFQLRLVKILTRGFMQSNGITYPDDDPATMKKRFATDCNEFLQTYQDNSITPIYASRRLQPIIPSPDKNTKCETIHSNFKERSWN